jgi:hypothetical protein
MEFASVDKTYEEFKKQHPNLDYGPKGPYTRRRFGLLKSECIKVKKRDTSACPHHLNAQHVAEDLLRAEKKRPDPRPRPPEAPPRAGAPQGQPPRVLRHRLAARLQMRLLQGRKLQEESSLPFFARRQAAGP